MVEISDSPFAVGGAFASPFGGAPAVQKGEDGSVRTPLPLVASGISGGGLFGIDLSVFVKVVVRELGINICGGKSGTSGEKMIV